MNKPHIREAIIVEGRYDKNTLSQVVDALIIETNGFHMFHDESLRNTLRSLADSCGIIIMTDSDSAGFLIRNRIRSYRRKRCFLQTGPRRSPFPLLFRGNSPAGSCRIPGASASA